MSFAARTLGYLAYDTTATFNVTVGVGSTTGGPGPTSYAFWGWSAFGVPYSPAHGQGFPDTANGSASPPTFKGATILGVESRDAGAGGSNASFYYLYLSGNQTAITLSTISIGGTLLSTLSITSAYDNTYSYSPAQPAGVTKFLITPTTVTTTLFGTTAGVIKAVILT
jgi:hypothetical protein